MLTRRQASLRVWFLLLCGALAFALLGCGPPWTIVHQASPSPFLGTPHFTVNPVTWNNTLIGRLSEAEYKQRLAGRRHGASRVAEFEAGKAAFGLRMLGALADRTPHFVMEPAGPTLPTDGFVINVNVDQFEAGFYAVFAAEAASAQLHVTITDISGQVLDEFLVGAQVQASGGYTITAARMERLSRDLGAIIAKYLRGRNRPPRAS